MGAVRTSQGIITTTPSAFVTCRAATGAKGCSVSHNWESARERWTAVSCEAAAAMLCRHCVSVGSATLIEPHAKFNASPPCVKREREREIGGGGGGG